MKVRLLCECDGPHPDYDHRKPTHPDRNPISRTLPAGEVIDDPNAWRLCMGTHFELSSGNTVHEDAQAEPVDDEARAAVKAAIERQRTLRASRLHRQEQAVVEQQHTSRKDRVKSSVS